MLLKPGYLYVVFLAIRIFSVNAEGSPECTDDPNFHVTGRSRFTCKYIATLIKMCEENMGNACNEACYSIVDGQGSSVGDKCPVTCGACDKDYFLYTAPPTSTEIPSGPLTKDDPVGEVLEYPYACVDDSKDLPDIPDGLGNFINVCKWVSISPENRCNTPCPCIEEDKKPLKYFCRETCDFCPGIPSAYPSPVPTSSPTTSSPTTPSPTTSSPTTSSPTTSSTTSCVDKENALNVFVNGENLGFCQWVALNPEKRCDAICPCGEDEGSYAFEFCPSTCNRCETEVPSSSPSNTPTLFPSAAPSICEDKEECWIAGDGDALTPLCDYAAVSAERCEESFLEGGLVKDFCRHTCYVCRPKGVPVCFDTGTDKKIFVSGNMMPICAWAAINPEVRCNEDCPCGEDEGSFVEDVCQKTCGKCI